MHSILLWFRRLGSSPTITSGCPWRFRSSPRALASSPPCGACSCSKRSLVRHATCTRHARDMHARLNALTISHTCLICQAITPLRQSAPLCTPPLHPPWHPSLHPPLPHQSDDRAAGVEPRRASAGRSRVSTDGHRANGPGAAARH